VVAAAVEVVVLVSLASLGCCARLTLKKYFAYIIPSSHGSEKKIVKPRLCVASRRAALSRRHAGVCVA